MIRRMRAVVVMGVVATALVVATTGVGGVGTASALPRIPGLDTLLPRPVAPDNQLGKRFDRMSRALTKAIPGRVGLAVVAVGGAGAESFGSVRSARAWSTLKVPVSIAAQRHGGRSVGADIQRAIRASDNDAAERLWGAIGGGQRSVDAVTAVLREGGDLTTHVASEVDRPRSYPGATAWSLENQAQFGAHLPCLRDAGGVLGHMRAVEDNQRWGIRSIRQRGVSTAVKGGWGPVSENTGKYVVRQLGIVTTNRGSFAVSMAAIPASGSFADGTAMLSRIGGWVGANLATLPAGRC